MKKVCLVICTIMLSLLCTDAYAYTLTFDDIPWNNPSYYFDTYGISFDGLKITNHSGSSWGTPHSGNKVLFSDAAGWSKFDFKGKYPDYKLYERSFSAYFSTQQDVVVNMSIYDGDRLITSVQIGAPGEAWENRFIAVDPAIPYNKVVFLPVNYNGLGFCLDDLTIIPVPEPASFAVLGIGLLPLGIALRRRLSKGELSAK